MKMQEGNSGAFSEKMEVCFVGSWEPLKHHIFVGIGVDMGTEKRKGPSCLPFSARVSSRCARGAQQGWQERKRDADIQGSLAQGSRLAQAPNAKT